MSRLKKYNEFINTRVGFFSLLIGLLWLKNMFAYVVDFHLSIQNPMQLFILLINPLSVSMLLISIGLFIKRSKVAYTTLFIIYGILTIWLFSNAVYYREFTDFITINTMLGAGQVSTGLGESAVRLFRWYDIFYILDLFALPVLLFKKKIIIEEKHPRFRKAAALSALSLLICSGNIFLAEIDRSGLLSRQFSREYLVKYLGVNAFTVYDSYQTFQNNQIRAEASPNDLKEVKSYIREHYAEPNDSMFGIAKGKNVVYIHLESFQQFLIDYQLTDENGVNHTVTPFLNSLYHGESTYSFDNFFHQVKAGKTSDAETLMENSLFGLNQGALFTQLGDKNTFEAAPNILNQKAGYTSAVFHGHSASFWNRDKTYKHLGFDYFFDSSYYDVNDDNSFQYGMHDKPFLSQSVQYLEHLQQPFYAKFITVSNHYPYSSFKNDEDGFPLANTKDETINGYFATANYLDTALKEFFDYMKASGLYDKSIFVLYGDHYGISNTRNKELSSLLGKDSDSWTDFDNAQLQRVPFMIHVPGATNGGINHTYGGQVDALPTLLHLLGIDSKKYLQLGQDLFSADHKQVVAFRDGDFVTPQYTFYGGKMYDNQTAQVVDEPTPEQEKTFIELNQAVDEQLITSDKITNGDLLRYYQDSGLNSIDPSSYDYRNQKERLEEIERQKGAQSSSLYSEKNQRSTVGLYKTKSYQQYE
ncbi:LTA synthase family protein [Enterococcus avium]|uniref:LTA synthase family protein n=1 Tax=Enterococcus avium TaxID=33945 RepID=UPI00232F3922|nr:LTA synthase family protein [Enterococcus avium]MDB1749423.1 LTA synthase family protein [Enterococcus avium]MDB1753681.1 LTA synthase family protein [Enterococcus avium]MDB1760680.1 LTA synthase family protein [Enterococcus avium]